MVTEATLSVAFMAVVLMLALYLRGSLGWRRVYMNYPLAASALVGLLAGLFVSAFNVAVLGVNPPATFFITMSSTMTITWIRRPI